MFVYVDMHVSRCTCVYVYTHIYTRDRHESILGIIKTTILPNSQEKICITAFLSEQHPLEADLSRLHDLMLLLWKPPFY